MHSNKNSRAENMKSLVNPDLESLNIYTNTAFKSCQFHTGRNKNAVLKKAPRFNCYLRSKIITLKNSATPKINSRFSLTSDAETACRLACYNAQNLYASNSLVAYDAG